MARFLGLLLVIGVSSSGPVVGWAAGWSAVVAPARGGPRAIGVYTAGCVQGAVALPPESQGFQTMRPQRRRFFGHPALVRYVQALGAVTDQQGLGVLLIGDLGQARGGPMPSGHRSHQNGLDVDIWYRLPPAGSVLPVAERETVSAPSMLRSDGRALDERSWSWRQADLLRLAAEFDVVGRVFVHPQIKSTLCRKFTGASWLKKLRPWWGHDDHFHVRLRCPVGETSCQDQEPPPAGDGCGDELAWWFTDEAQQPPLRPDTTKVPLPAACEAILRQ